MKLKVDKEADALYIQFQKSSSKAKKTLKLRDGILIDIAADGKIFGIEILDVSRRIPLKELAHVDVRLPIHA